MFAFPNTHGTPPQVHVWILQIFYKRRVFFVLIFSGCSGLLPYQVTPTLLSIPSSTPSRGLVRKNVGNSDRVSVQSLILQRLWSGCTARTLIFGHIEIASQLDPPANMFVCAARRLQSTSDFTSSVVLCKAWVRLFAVLTVFQIVRLHSCNISGFHVETTL